MTEPPLTPIERLLKPLISDLATTYRNYARWCAWTRLLQAEQELYREKDPRVLRTTPRTPSKNDKMS